MDMDANRDTEPSHDLKYSSASNFLRGASLGVDNAQPRPPATPTPTAPTAALRAPAGWTGLARAPKKDHDEEQAAGTAVMAMAIEVHSTQRNAMLFKNQNSSRVGRESSKQTKTQLNED